MEVALQHHAFEIAHCALQPTYTLLGMALGSSEFGDLLLGAALTLN